MPIVIGVPIAAILAVLLALLLYYARGPLEGLLTRIIPDVNIPLVGNLRAIAVGTVTASIDWALSGLAAGWGYAERFLLNWIGVLAGWFHGITLAMDAAFHALDTAIYGTVLAWVRDVTKWLGYWVRALSASIAHVFAALYAAIVQAERAAIGTAHAELVTVAHVIEADVRAVDAALWAGIADVDRYLTGQLLADVHALTGAIDSVLAYAETGLGRAAAALDAGVLEAERAAAALAAQAVTVAEGYASQAVQGAVRALDTAVDDALSGILVDVGAAVAAVEGIIGTDLPDIGAALRAIPRDVVDLAGVATLVGTVALTLTRYLETCGIPNCRNLSYLGRVLQDVIGMVEAGAFVAFVIEAIDHPQDTARIAYDIAHPVVATTESALRAMVTL